MRRLEGPELSRYHLIPPELAARVRVVQVPVLPPGAAGMTLGRFVFVRSDTDRSGRRELLAHELVHVRQFEEHGTVGFLRHYLGQYASSLRTHRRHRRAYLEMPFEIEARTEARRWREQTAADDTRP
jgi:hypothetical protein